MRNRVCVLFSSLLLLLAAQPSLAVTTVDLNSTTPQQLAQLLAGGGVTVSNVTFTGANVAGGSFSGGLADGLGIESGVILSSGNVANAAGPNDDDGVTAINERPGDPDLNAIVGAGHTTFDAAVLEFDFVPSSNGVSFRYVFVSDEYNEFVGQFNDVFAFFIDGQNVALIPGTNTPVAINTVNLQTNSSFFRNNDPSDLGVPTPFVTQFDGFTTVLTATATLTPNVSHHIKLAIADTDDFLLDSAVFLQAASFTSQNLTIAKSAPASVTSGANLTYTITYGNSGNSNASNVVIRDPVPAVTSFVSATNGGVLSEAGVVTWNVGTLPAGVGGQTVSFTVHVNAISGTVDNVNYTIEGTGVGPISGAPVSTAITPGCPVISLAPATLPGGAVGSAYDQTFAASGGTAPYAFSVTSGALPPDLMLSSGGVLSGTPTGGGTFSFTVRAFDANECSGSRSYTLSITGGCGSITISPSVLFEGFVGVAYNRALHGAGGIAPYRFSVTSGSLPSGLDLSPGGVVSGTPTTPGTYTFRIRAVDANGCAGAQNYTVTVSCPPTLLSPGALPPASQGVTYDQAITVLGGAGPWQFSAGTGLPPGLMLLPSGAFSGAPTQSGTFTFTVTATDANGCATSLTYTLAVCTALAVSPEALPAAIVGAPFTATIAASGGTAPFSYAQTGLPSTLTLDPATGVISGTPTAAGVVNVTVVATDANGCTGGRTYIFRICPLLALSPSTLEGGAVGVPYSATTFVASGGTAPYAYTSTGLPSGLGLSPAGAVSGTPMAAGTFTVTVTATDANGCAVSRSYTIPVTDAPPRIADLTLSPAATGFTLAIAGSGFVDGATVVIDGVSYPATFVSPTLLTVMVPASAIPATGAITVTVRNPGSTGGTSNPASLTFCAPPGAPVNPTIAPFGNPTGPVTATDFLSVDWEPPAAGPAPSSYAFRINGDPYTVVAGGTSAVAPPRGSNDPITLFVRAHCNADVAGPESTSSTYSLAPPAADFTFSAASVGSPAIFTDTSSPQATSWFWIFDDGGTSTAQSPSHTFTTAGTHRVALIATNGSGSSQTIKDVAVSPSASGGSVAASITPFTTSDGRRWRASLISISAAEPAWLELTSEATEETVVFLRFLGVDGRLVLERRISIPSGEAAVNDVSAYGLEGVVTLELVSSREIAAVLAQPDRGLRKKEGGPAR